MGKLPTYNQLTYRQMLEIILHMPKEDLDCTIVGADPCNVTMLHTIKATPIGDEGYEFWIA